MYHPFGIRSGKDRISCNQCISTGSHQTGTCFQVHTAIHLDQRF